MTEEFGSDEALRLFRTYNVGTSDKYPGACIFWQVDRENKIRGGKIIPYDSRTGHRATFPDSKSVKWVHSEMRIAGFHQVQCFFGEHLLASNPDATVMLVESEKTSLIASHHFPEFVWLATGGKHGCMNANASQTLMGRDVILVPDLGCIEEWRKKADNIRPMCHRVRVWDGLEKIATPEQMKAGEDISDFLLRREKDIINF